MLYRILTEDGDYSFGNSSGDFYKDVPLAVAQAVQTRLALFVGEWYLDITSGTPWMQGVIGKKSKDEADLTIQRRINGTQGLLSIESFETVLNRETRDYSGNISINTIYGPTDLEVKNYVNL